jgi:hypothetical protein
VIDPSLPGWPQWIRVPWLRGLYWPFWRTVNRIRRGWRAATDYSVELVTFEELVLITSPLDHHPDGWDHYCACEECRSLD